MTVSEMVERLVAGTLTQADAEAALRGKTLTGVSTRSAEQTVVADAVGDYDVPEPGSNSFGKIYAAYVQGRLTDEQYEGLYRAAHSGR